MQVRKAAREGGGVELTAAEASTQKARKPGRRRKADADAQEGVVEPSTKKVRDSAADNQKATGDGQDASAGDHAKSGNGSAGDTTAVDGPCQKRTRAATSAEDIQTAWRLKD